VDSNEFARLRIERYKARVGFGRLAGMVGPDGVRADWEELPHALGMATKGLKLDSRQLYGSGTGVGEQHWLWTRHRQTELTVKVFVFGAGTEAAHQMLLRRSTATNMVEIPYQAGPPSLGDLAVESRKPPSHVLMWVYRNVFVQVHNDRSGLDLDPIATAIQAFMSAHHVPRIAEHLPRVSAIDVAPKQVHVGDQVKVSIVLSADTRPESVVTDIREIHTDLTATGELKLSPMVREPLSVSYRADLAGQAQVDVSVLDRKTLLSPPLSVTIDVLPAP
jgi:hypothetical protein